MKSMLHSFADDFSAQQEHKTQEEDEQRSIRNPVVFLFIGDFVADALETIYKINENKWHNSSGVMYFHAYETKTVERKNIVAAKLPKVNTDRTRLRKDLYDQFLSDEEKLFELNKSFRKIAIKIAEYGRMYSSRQKINLSVVTRIDDPANVTIQEMTLLLKSVLLESFKTVEVDFYGLIKEQSDGDGFGYSSSLGISFLKELDFYQRDDYSFHQLLQITEDYLKLPVKHNSAPLFDIAYLLSDKDENGLFSHDSFMNNYEMISQINLLKNQKMITENNENSDGYNNSLFRKNIQGNSARNVYATAGFSKVKRPNKIIALNAAHHFAAYYQSSLKEAAKQPKEKVMELFELSHSAFQRSVLSMIPEKRKLEDMNELMWNPTNYSSLKMLSVKEAEELLFEGVAEDFFQENIIKKTYANLEKLNIQDKLESHIFDRIINNKEYGLFCAYAWSSEKEEFNSVRDELRRMILSFEKQKGELKGELEQAYQQMVDSSNFPKSYLPFSDKKNLRAFIFYLFGSVYGIKYEIIATTSIIDYLKQYEAQLENMHEFLAKRIEQILEVNSSIKEAAIDSLNEADDYIGKNVREYYEGIVSAILVRIQNKWGQGFFADDRFLGRILDLLDKGSTTFLDRVLQICTSEILTQEEFNKTFEDELFERSNVKTHYDNRDVLSREEIFKQLYKRLDEYSAVQIEVYNYTHKHRYEEKYFFGDYTSDFLKYAFDRENQSRHYKVGCVHEKKTSGIEKLRIMGGFQITDLMFFRNNLKYYEAYLENGFMLHGPVESVMNGGEEDAFEKI